MGNLPIDTSAAPVDLTAIAVNALVCAVLAFLLAWHFRRFGSTFSNRSKFARVLLPIALTTMLVITIVKSNLVLSLGLVGALSIVRFRAPVKEPEELAYLFLAIALGLGIGAETKGLRLTPAGPREVAVLVFAILLALLTARRALRGEVRYPNLYLNVELAPAGRTGGGAGALAKDLIDLVSRHSRRSDLRRLDTRPDLLQASFHLDLGDAERLAAMEAELRRSYPTAAITFVEQSGLPGA